MKQVILNIPDKNYDFIIELMTKLNFSSVDNELNDVPSEVQQLVLDRLKKSKRENLISWEEAKAKLKF